MDNLSPNINAMNYSNLPNEFQLNSFPNESPFPLPLQTYPTFPDPSTNNNNMIELQSSDFNQSFDNNNIPRASLPLNRDNSGQSGDTEIISSNNNHINNNNVHNQININSRLMPSIEPWNCNQIGTNHDNNVSSTNIFRQHENYSYSPDNMMLSYMRYINILYIIHSFLVQYHSSYKLP